MAHAPSPNSEHQRMERDIELAFLEIIERLGLGEARHQVNVLDPVKGMGDYRIPDISVVLAESAARLEDDITGGPGFIVEIRSPWDETLDKLPWYARQGVREALIVERDSKELTLHALQGAELRPVGSSPAAVESRVAPLRFERVSEGGRARLRVTYTSDPGRVWLV